MLAKCPVNLQDEASSIPDDVNASNPSLSALLWISSATDFNEAKSLMSVISYPAFLSNFLFTIIP